MRNKKYTVGVKPAVGSVVKLQVAAMWIREHTKLLVYQGWQQIMSLEGDGPVSLSRFGML